MMRFATLLAVTFLSFAVSAVPRAQENADTAVPIPKPVQKQVPKPVPKPVLLRDHSGNRAVRSEYGKTPDTAGPLETKSRKTRIRQTALRASRAQKPETLKSSFMPPSAPKPPRPTVKPDTESTKQKPAAQRRPVKNRPVKSRPVKISLALRPKRKPAQKIPPQNKTKPGRADPVISVAVRVSVSKPKAKPRFITSGSGKPKAAEAAKSGPVKSRRRYTTPTRNGRKPEPYAKHNEDFQACLNVLAPYKISFQRVPDHRKANGCRIYNGLKISAIEGVAIQPAATLNCDMALRTAKWIRSIQPLAATYFGSGISRIRHMSAYSCRFRSSGKISEHGLGNALDVGSMTMSNGQKTSVLNHWYSNGTPERDAFAGFWSGVSRKACDAYRLLLSPASNADHKNHLHLDAGHWKLCER